MIEALSLQLREPEAQLWVSSLHELLFLSLWRVLHVVNLPVGCFLSFLFESSLLSPWSDQRRLICSVGLKVWSLEVVKVKLTLLMEFPQVKKVNWIIRGFGPKFRDESNNSLSFILFTKIRYIMGPVAQLHMQDFLTSEHHFSYGLNMIKTNANWFCTPYFFMVIRCHISAINRIYLTYNPKSQSLSPHQGRIRGRSTEVG